MAILTSAGITFGDSTTQTTAAVAGVTSLNGQTGAITDTTYGAIGSYCIAAGSTNTIVAAGATIAGSSLVHKNNTTNTAQAIWDGQDSASTVSNMSLSGTYRAMNRVGNYGNVFGGTGYLPTLWVRIS